MATSPEQFAFSRALEDLREAANFATQALRDAALEAANLGHRGIRTATFGAIEAAQDRLLDAKASLALAWAPEA
jgi:hypothetical protein